MRKSVDKITIDGILDEQTWQQADRGGEFYQGFPTDTQYAVDSTQFMVSYDNQYIYVGIICYDYLPGKPITNTLKRDFNWINNDNVSFYIDPYNDRSNGFTFQVTPDNVQREGLVVLGGDVQSDWDNKWFSEVSKGENYWAVEMVIPYKSIRYNSVPEWNMQFIRNNQKRNERSSWIRVPQQFRASDLVYSGKIVWDTPPPEAGTNIALIPYTNVSAGKNFEESDPAERNADIGFDAKIGLSNSVNLDLTVNPDFSQVEADQQITNLQRFEISFPEKRQFFLENQDLFAENGFRVARPFFSRRIGIQGSGSTQRNVPIIGGARLSGKIGSKWRVGVLNMVTNEDETEEEISPAQNYSVAVLEKQIFKRSRVSAVFVGRTNLGQSALDTFSIKNGHVIDNQGNEVSPRDTLLTTSKYNYVYGLDYNLSTINNRWTGSFFYHRSVDPGNQSDNFAQGNFIRYQTTKVNWRGFLTTSGEGFNAEVGFVPRSGVTRYGTRLDYNYYTEGLIQQHGPSIGVNWVADRNWKNLDRRISGDYEFQFLNSSRIEIGGEWQSVILQSSFDPSKTDGQELKEGSKHAWLIGFISYNSDQRKPFTYEFFAGTGGFFNGTRSAFGGKIVYRNQPVMQLGVQFEYNKISLPESFNDADLFLISPRLDLTFTNKLFFTTLIQYNTQDENLGHNSRFQWRFKPVSDLFIVYTDTYVTEKFRTRDRTLVIKLSYWLNL